MKDSNETMRQVASMSLKILVGGNTYDYAVCLELSATSSFKDHETDLTIV